MQIERDTQALNYAEMLDWYEYFLNLATIQAFCSGELPTPEYPDRLNKKYAVWEELTVRCKLPPTARKVILNEIKNGAWIGFEVAPPSVAVEDKKWKDMKAWNACAKATIQAIEHGIINTHPPDVKRVNKYFTVDKKSDPDTPNKKLYREIFHASSTVSGYFDLRARPLRVNAIGTV